jgi:hypothetical protein
MTIVWGEWNNWGSTNGGSIRLGMEITLSPVTSSSTNCVITVDIYTQNERSFASAPDVQNLNYYDDWTFPQTTYTNAEGTSPVYRVTKTYTYNYGSYYGQASPANIELSVEIHDGPIPFITQHVAIPGRLPAPPAAPSAVVLTRNTDTQATLTWTRNATTGNPYANQTIQMRTWSGSTPWTEASWANIAAVAGTATSYVKSTGLQSNRVYQFRIRSENAGGSSAWVNSGVIFMTPAAPTGVTSAMNSTGTAITTTWTDAAYAYTPTNPLSWKIQRSVNGGAFADIGTVATQSTTTFTDNTANTAQTNAYRVAAVVGSLQSAYATAATVPAATPPLAPTLLAPNGVSVDLVNDVNRFSWQHNPGATNVVQTHFTIRWSSNGGSTWNTLANDIASANQFYDVPAGALANGVPYLWQVRTEGVVSAGYGAYSASAALTGSTKPVVTLTSPTASTNTLHIIATWTYAQAELLPQAAYQALLYDATGTLLLEEIDGFDATTTVSFAYAAVSGVDYVVKVRAQSSLGIWSNYSTVTTNYFLFPPADVGVTGEFQPCLGTVLLHFTPTASVPGTTVDVASVTLERRTVGTDWVTLAEGLLVPTDFLDTLPATNGVNEYRVTAVSLTPSRKTMPVFEVDGTDGLSGVGVDPLWVWIAYGDNFENVLRVHGDLQISEATNRQRANQHFLGRARPVALVGQATDRAVSVGGKLFFDQTCSDLVPDNCRYDSPPAGWSVAGSESDVVCYRDFQGRRLFGTLGGVNVGLVNHPGLSSVSFTVTEVDFTERYVQVVVA